MGDLTELVQSISEKGILEPVLVRPLATDEAGPRGSEFLVISGERRYQAARQAGLTEIPVIIMDVSPDEALEIALIENLQRKDLTPFEEAEGYRALGDVHGYTHEEIASAVSKARSSVTESLQLLKLSPQVRSAAEALGIESKSILLEVLKSGSTLEAQIKLLERIAEEGLGRRELRQEAQKKKPRRRQEQSSGAPVFTFKDPEKSFSVSVRFRKKTVEKTDLIAALEKILGELKAEE